MGWMRRSLGLACAFALVALAGPPVVASSAVEQARVSVWTESAYESVFRDSGPSDQAGRTIALDTARSEYEAAQVVLRSRRAFTVSGVTFSSLTGRGGRIPAGELSYDFVGYEFLDHNSVFAGTQDVNPTVRSAPGWFPDRLLNDTSIAVDANSTQSIWVRVHVPESARAGVYRGAAIVRTTAGNLAVPITVDVRDVLLPSPDRSEFTNPMWQNILGFTSWDRGAGDTIELTYKYKRYSPQWWQFIDRWAEITKRYRNNNVQLPLITLLLEGGSTVDADGNYTFNWSKVDQVVDRIRSHGGVKRLEGFAMSGPHGEASPWYDPTLPQGTWMSEQLMRDPATGAVVHGWKKWDSAESANWRAQFIPALRAHVAAKGWTDLWWQHVGDEPGGDLGRVGWTGVAEHIRQFWPDVKIGDAMFSEPVASEVAKQADIMIPNLLNYFWNGKTYDDLRTQQGKELWFYNCNIPPGNFLNRFVDQPQWHQRLTMWFAYSRGATGYLHWAYNNWQYTMERQDVKGDGFIVRADVPRNTLEVSPRYESLRDGIEDWEVLNQLGRTNPGLARDLARSMTPNSDKYSVDTAYMQRLRRIALDAAAGEPVIANDLARRKAATASSGNAAAAFDGRTSTGWQPATGSQWLQVDLGRQVQLDGLRLHWGETFAGSYRVLQSYDGSTWAPTFATGDGDGGDDFVGTNGKARYLRIEVTAAETPYRLTDVEVAGHRLHRENLAGGASYTRNPEPPGPRFLDSSGREATDGVLADDWGDGLAFGYELSENGRRHVDAQVTVDLGRSRTIDEVRAHVYQEYPYYRPDEVTVAVSNDNVHFAEVGRHGYADTAKEVWYEVDVRPVKARWVRLTYTKSWAPKATGVFVDDIEVY
jgi:F5/8 type C domain/Domain of unknown function (DUF4091)